MPHKLLFNMEIKYLKHKDIDKNLWDNTISTAYNSLPYAYSWYLDVVSPGWEALVADNYHFVMPLPLKKKWGIKYLIQPRWVQQLGIFSNVVINKAFIPKDIVLQFISKIPYLIYDFNINHANNIDSVNKRINYIIPPTESMEQIRGNYNSNTKRNIAKATKAGLSIANISLEQFITLWQNENTDKAIDLQQKLEPLIFAAQNNKLSGCERNFEAKLLGVFQDDTLVAALFSIVNNNRLLYLTPVSNLQGKECRAMFLLVDYILEHICVPNGLIFDCEGSMIPGVATFYKGFGAIEQNYTRISHWHPAKIIALIRRNFYKR